MIVTVTAGKDYNNRNAICNALTMLYRYYEIKALCHNATTYTDIICDDWCTDWFVPCYIMTIDTAPRPNYGIIFPGGDFDTTYTGLTIWKPY